MRGRTTWMAAVTGATLLLPAAAPLPLSGAGRPLVVGAAHPTALPRPTLRLGASGPAVTALQERLRALGARVSVDGRFGMQTRLAVIALQASRGLAPDGIVGPLTWQVVDGGGPVLAPVGAKAVLRLGSTGALVAEAQRLLTRAGHPTPADGRFGPSTQAAVTAFQRARRLSADGVVGPATWAALAGAPGPVGLRLSGQPQPWPTFGAGTHVVSPGETLATIAAATGSTAPALAAANRVGLRSRLSVGATLRVPGPWRCVVPGGTFINDYGFARSAGRIHQGNDLFAARGTPVLAPVGGRTELGRGPVGGLTVNLYGADGHRYYFAHLDRQEAGGPVTAGAVIGYVGNSGNAVSTPPHLHFEIHPGGGEAVNPFPTLVLACRR